MIIGRVALLVWSHVWNPGTFPNLDKEAEDTDRLRRRFALIICIVNCIGYICIPVVVIGFNESSCLTWIAFPAVGVIIMVLNRELMRRGKTTFVKIMLPGLASLVVGIWPILLWLPHQKIATGLVIFVPLIFMGIISAWIRFSPIIEAATKQRFLHAPYDVQREWIKGTAAFWRTVAISLTFGFVANIIPLIYWSRGIAGTRDGNTVLFCVFYAICYTGYMIVGPIRLSFQKAWDATDRILPK